MLWKEIHPKLWEASSGRRLVATVLWNLNTDRWSWRIEGIEPPLGERKAGEAFDAETAKRDAARRWAELLAALGLVAAGTAIVEKPLFIPLRAEWYRKIESGEKSTEYRAYGPRWNEKQCRVGRAVTASLGYGKAHRLAKVVAGFKVLNQVDAPPEARAIYPDAAYIAAIELG